MILMTHSPSPVSYPDALDHMMNRVEQIKNKGSEELWFLEHPALYTAGTSAKKSDLLEDTTFPVFQTGRGGQFTYHGPGQRVVYIMIDLNQREKDLHRYVRALEQWIIDTLADFYVVGERREGRVGVWVKDPSTDTLMGNPAKNTPPGESKIAAIGVRVSHWITYHGISINVHPDLDHYNGIVPCGLPTFGVTSLHKLGVTISLEELDEALKKNWMKNDFLSGLSVFKA